MWKALSFWLALTTAAPAAAAERMYQPLENATLRCGTTLEASGKAMAWREPLTEEVRKSLSAAIFLSLHDFTGTAKGPSKEQADCPVARFEADNVVWTLSTGAIPLAAISPARDEWFYLQKAPNLRDAGEWNRTRQGLPAGSASPIFLLILSFDEAEQAIIEIYDGLPSPQRLAEDIAAAYDRKSRLLGAYRRDGGTVMLQLDTESGLPSTIFAPLAVSETRPAVLRGVDGWFFTKQGDDVIFRGSGFACAREYKGFIRRSVELMNPAEETLDLGCTLEKGDGSLWISVTRIPDAKNDKTYFDRRFRALMENTEGVGSTVLKGGGGRSPIQMSRYWSAADGQAYSLFLARRGDYMFDILAGGPTKDFEAANAAAVVVVEQISPGQ